MDIITFRVCYMYSIKFKVDFESGKLIKKGACTLKKQKERTHLYKSWRKILNI